MISSSLKITLVFGVGIYFVTIFIFLKNKAIALKYTLLWLLAGMILGLMIVWPKSLLLLSNMLGITDSMNGLFVVSISFIAMITMSLTSIVSKQSEKIRILTQSIAKIEKRIREIEDSRVE